MKAPGHRKRKRVAALQQGIKHCAIGIRDITAKAAVARLESACCSLYA